MNVKTIIKKKTTHIVSRALGSAMQFEIESARHTESPGGLVGLESIKEVARAHLATGNCTPGLLELGMCLSFRSFLSWEVSLWFGVNTPTPPPSGRAASSF